MFRDLAWGLASRGIVVLRYKKRTLEHPASVGTEYTVNEETVQDAVAGLTFLREHSSVDPNRVFVVGYSLGAGLVPRILAGATWAAGGVLLAGSPRPLGELVVEQVEYLSGLDGVVAEQEEASIREARAFRAQSVSATLRAEDIVSLFGSSTPGSYWLDLQAYDPIRVAHGLSHPLLVLHGARDYQVTGKDFELWQKGLADRKGSTTFRLLAGLNHLFIAGKGRSTPAEYQVKGFLSVEVVDAISGWAKTVP